MKKISNLDKIKAASILEKQIEFSLKIPLNNLESHPIRLVQASKSLIGLNLDKPNQKLINFNSIYLENFNGTQYDVSSNFDDNLNPVVSIHNLEHAFLKKDKELVLKLFYELKLVSSEIHILEYLIEISLKQTGDSFLLIWSLYRSFLFLSNKDSNAFISLAADIILSDSFEDAIISEKNIDRNIDICEIINYELSFYSIDLYAHLLEAYNSDLIRLSKIRDLINSFINKKFKNYKSNQFNVNDDVSFPDFLRIGRKNLLQFIDDRNIENINTDLILFLDSIRAMFRFLDNQNHKVICFHFENILENSNV